jgi:tetratricopeptide (TPR) repeat protein
MSDLDPGPAVEERPAARQPGYAEPVSGAASRVDAVLHAEGWKSMPSVMALAGVVALLVRLAYLASFRDSVFFTHLMDEARWNFDWAEAWALGEWSPDGRGFIRPPLYPYWLSVLFRFFGHDLLVVRVIQALVGSATAAALAGVGFRLAGFGAGRVAGLLAALSGTLVFLDGELLGANLLLSLISWALFLFLGRPGVVRWGASAALLGLATVVETQMVALLPLFALWTWVRIRREAAPPLIQRLGPVLWLALSLTPPVAVSLGHLMSEGSFVFVAAHSGLDFYAGNHRFADGRTMDIPSLQAAPSGWDRALAARERAERAVGRDLSAREISNWWYHRGLDEIAERTGASAALLMRKAYYLVNAHEAGGDRDPYFERPGVLKGLLGRVGALSVPWGILFPLAVVGFARSLRDPSRRTAAFFLGAWFVVLGVVLVLFLVNAESRAGLLVPLFALAGAALARGPLLARAGAVAGLAALVVVNTSLWGVKEGGRAHGLSRLSESYFQAHGVDEATRTLETLERTNPRRLSTVFLLAEAYQRSGRAAEALPLYERVLAVRPEDPDVEVRLGTLLLRLGRYEHAAEVLEAAVRHRPTDKEAWSGLGDAHAALGRPRSAAAAYAQAVRLVPNEPGGYASLARLHMRQGEPDQAIKVLDAGTRRVRGSFDLLFLLALACSEADEMDRALEEVDKALELRPEDAAALRLQSWLSDRPR